MKHLTLTLGAFCIVALASAQRVENLQTFEHTKTKSSIEELTNARLSGVEALANQRGGGTILFEEDFSNGFEGSNGNGSWTIFDNANDNAWIYVASNGTSSYVDGTETGENHPAGDFSSNSNDLESTTAGNGWMILDCDFYNSPFGDGSNVQDVTGELISPVIDFSDAGSVILSWEQYFRYCCYIGAPLYVEVTNDGGETWTSFEAHGDFIEDANIASANPLPTSLDISCVAANNAEVQFKFKYTGDGYSHYYWGIDDVVITSNPNADDLEIVQLTNGDIWNVWEYRVTPMEQRIAASNGGVLAGVIYRNSGTENQENVDVVVEILDESGSTVLSSVIETLDIAYSFANAIDCPANAQDTVYIPTGWEPSSTGNYILRATIDAGTDDATPDNNTVSRVIVFTEDEYGHDDEGELTIEVSPADSDDVPGYYNPAGVGAFYHMVNGGSEAHGLLVTFGPDCGTNQDGQIAELEFETRIYTDGTTDGTFEPSFWLFDSDWAGTTQYLSFEDPVELEEDGVYFVAVISEFESEGALTVLAQPDSDTDFSTREFDQTGAGDFVWFPATFTPALRLILSERVNVDEIASLNGVSLLQNRPNPASSLTTFEFELNTSMDIQFEIRDLSGRVITMIDRGTLGAGNHTIDYNVNTLSGGMYTYTLIANGVTITKKLTVK